MKRGQFMITLPKTPAGRLALLKKMERTLGEMSREHGAGCRCGICESGQMLWNFHRHAMRPGIGTNPHHLGMTEEITIGVAP
jgi:hypothetical protein